MKIIPIKHINNRLVFCFFDCGNNDLNTYLQKYAFANDSVNISKTFVCLNDEENHILGYYTLCATNVMNANLPDTIKEKLPKYPCPCAKIARLAVEKENQNKGLGKELLKDAFLRIINASSSIGIYAITVDAKEESKTFYEKYNFIKLKNDSSEYILPLSTVMEALKLSVSTNKNNTFNKKVLYYYF